MARKQSSNFGRGGAYKCDCCKRATRATGRGDNEHVGLCAECYDLYGEENHLADSGELYSSPAEVIRLFEAIVAAGGKPGNKFNSVLSKAHATL